MQVLVEPDAPEVFKVAEKIGYEDVLRITGTVRARRFMAALVERVEQLSGARISAIGVGPARDATIVVHDLL